MGIDIYYRESNFSKVKEEYIYTIDDSSFDKLSNFIKFYKSKTGKVIDLYKDIKLYLQTFTTNKLILVKIENILINALDKDKCIIFYGD